MLSKLLFGIRHFEENKKKGHKALMASLSKGQSPDVIFFTCSDSRINPSLFTHSDLGTLFVNRNPGNMITPFYPSQPSAESATLEFGLENLHIREIIICGHSLCGAIQGLLNPGLGQQLPQTAAWLQQASVLLDKLNKDCPEHINTPGLKLQYLIQENILLQIEHLKTHPAVKKRLAEGSLKIHGWYYEIETGEVYIYDSERSAFVSFEQTINNIALKTLKAIVLEEATCYLRKALGAGGPETKALLVYKNISSANGLWIIWQHISSIVVQRFLEQIKALYTSDPTSTSPAFDAILNQAPTILQHNLETIYKNAEALEKQPITYRWFKPQAAIFKQLPEVGPTIRAKL